ncbi:unnamed protein product [Choristocarpus tenellus]
MWRALERIIPDIRKRTEVELVATPLTHEHYNRRFRGSYGPGWRAGEEEFPGCVTPLEGLLHCGDSTLPGLGLPAVAASGMNAARFVGVCPFVCTCVCVCVLEASPLMPLRRLFVNE